MSPFTHTGPPSSPFEGYEFLLRLDVGAEYPLVPPSIRFMTKCFHPNINFQTGEICLDILKKEWSPAWSLQSACRAVQSLLADPNSEVDTYRYVYLYFYCDIKCSRTLNSR